MSQVTADGRLSPPLSPPPKGPQGQRPMTQGGTALRPLPPPRIDSHPSDSCSGHGSPPYPRPPLVPLPIRIHPRVAPPPAQEARSSRPSQDKSPIHPLILGRKPPPPHNISGKGSSLVFPPRGWASTRKAQGILMPATPRIRHLLLPIRPRACRPEPKAPPHSLPGRGASRHRGPGPRPIGPPPCR